MKRYLCLLLALVNLISIEIVFADESPRFCAALRGNGPLITAHWASLAGAMDRRHEVIDGGMGGSSASITLFIYEGILNNPQLRSCQGGTRSCSKAEVVERASLLVKSLFGYLEVIKDSPEVTALLTATEKVKSVLAAEKASGKVQPSDAQSALEVLGQLKQAFSSDRALVSLLNPEIPKMLASVDNPSLQGYRVREVKEEMKNFGSFKADDIRILLRPGLVDFSALAKLVARVGNFYGGRGAFGSHKSIYNDRAMQMFLDKCAPGSTGHSWSDLKKTNSRCVRQMTSLMRLYRNAYIKAESVTHAEPSDTRLNDLIGNATYGHFVVTMAVLDQPEWREIKKRQDCYQNNDVACYKEPLHIYDRTHFGYFGAFRDVQKIDANLNHFSDLKSTKAKTYPEKTWRFALERSPSEPGLAKVLEFPGGATYAGWVDLHPVQQLKNLGCGTTVYITRRTAEDGGDDSIFAQGVAELVGMTKNQQKDFYLLENRESSISQALRLSDGVWCTDWDAFKPLNVSEIEQNAYTAPLYPQSVLSKGGRHYRGCGPAENSLTIEQGVNDKGNLAAQ